MADVHDKKTRSYNMSQIRSGNTKPELIVRKYLHAKGLRFKLHDNKLPGKPDIVLPKYKTVIEVHGCFWHGHTGCKYYVIPVTRTKWWVNKINKTIEQDVEKQIKLNSMGWKTIVIWECELKGNKKEKILERIYNKIICQN